MTGIPAAHKKLVAMGMLFLLGTLTFRYGYCCDFILRATMPSLIAMAFVISLALTAKEIAPWRSISFALVFTVAAVAPAFDIIRGATEPRREFKANTLITLFREEEEFPLREEFEKQYLTKAGKLLSFLVRER